MMFDFAEFTDHNSEDLRIVVCPLCGEKRGDSFKFYCYHLENEHTWSDLGLGPDPFADVQDQPVATDGGRDQEVRG